MMENELIELSQTIKEIATIGKEYAQSYDELNKIKNNKTTNIKYSIQSYCIHRGFYCPSPIEEIVVGGIKRGKLTDKIRKSTKNYYKYYFDKDNHMLAAEEYTSDDFDFSPYAMEFLIRINNDIEYGFTFHNKWKEITFVSKSQFENGLIKSYSAGLYDDNPEKMTIQYEKYYYDSNQILTNATFFYNASLSMGFCDRHDYKFIRNKKEEICKYEVTSEFEGDLSTQIFVNNGRGWVLNDA